MTDQEIEEIVDQLIKRLPIGKKFVLCQELNKYLKSIGDNTDANSIVERVVDFMVENQYIKDNPNDIEDCLSPTGIKAKEKGGHFAQQKYLEPKKEYWFTKYQVSIIILTVISLLWSVYVHFQNNELKSLNQSQGQKLDSLNIEFRDLIYKLDSVTEKHERLKKQVENEQSKTMSLDSLTK